MKHVKIIIMVDSDNENLNYSSTVCFVKSEITKYFGTKNVVNEETTQPSMIVLCEVTNEDLNHIVNNINIDSINLFAVIIPDNFSKIKGRILDLSE